MVCTPLPSVAAGEGRAKKSGNTEEATIFGGVHGRCMRSMEYGVIDYLEELDAVMVNN